MHTIIFSSNQPINYTFDNEIIQLITRHIAFTYAIEYN